MLRALALLVLLAAPAALAQGSLGVTPAELRVGDAQRGETYLREITLQNEFDTASSFDVDREGETGGWARTEPPAPIVVPPRAQQKVRVHVAVPEDAANGAYEGAVRLVGEAKARPDGSGLSLRQAVAVPLRVEVGGAQAVRLAFGSARVDDAERGTAPRLLVEVSNEGNVRAPARVDATVEDAKGAAVAQAWNATSVRPGERLVVEVPLPDDLPEGTYRVRAQPAGAPALEAHFKVVPPGTLGKSGELRYLQHETVAREGFPVRVAGLFVNTGTTTIASAKLTGEVHLDGRLVAVLESEPRLVRPGESVELVAYFTAPGPGSIRLAAHVLYDGFASGRSDGVLVAAQEVAPRATPGAGGWLVLAGAAAALAVGVGLYRTRR